MKKSALTFHLGEMKSENGSALEYEVDLESFKCAIRMSEIVASTPEFRLLQQRVPSKRLPIYFQFIIQEKIYPYIAQACAIRWGRREHKPGIKDEGVYVPDNAIFSVLKRCWKFGDVGIELTLSLGYIMLCRELLRGIKSRMNAVLGDLFSTGDERPICPPAAGKRIACAYTEGLNFSKRNDLNWFFDSGIDPKQVLIFFDIIDGVTGKPISPEMIAGIEEMGFDWVSVNKGVVSGKERLFKPKAPPRHIFLDERASKDAVGRWVAREGNNLIKEVDAWQQFCKRYNIGVAYAAGECTRKHIMQAIAFDAGGAHSGVFVGKQRSEIYELNGWWPGNYPKRILFVWNRRTGKYLKPEINGVDTLVVSGFPYDISARSGHAHSYSKALKEKGAKFIIALFDNSHARFSPYSLEEISRFYEVFLKWAIDDPDIGIIIKSKASYVIGGLPSIRPALKKAISTARCIKVEDERRRLPSDASIGADMAIGCGIASAVTEAVIGGCKGIHYDSTKFKSHEFYDWGYERLIFDDIDRLIRSLKEYKQDPSKAPRLGDWSDHMEDIDPFHDSKGGQRMGTYMKSLLDGLNRGLDKDAAVDFANRLYSERWGADKIIDLNNERAK